MQRRPGPPVAPGVGVVVLTGGGSTRMGAHKPALVVGGRSIVERVVAACRPHPTVVVGRSDAVPPEITVVVEDPPGGGPVAGLSAGLSHLLGVTGPGGPDVVLVVAGDLPLLTAGHLGRLCAALAQPVEGASPRAGVAVTLDAEGRRNWLCAAWPAPILRDRLGALAPVAGRSMRSLTEGLVVVDVADPEGLASDVDTPADLARVRARLDPTDDPA
ncbi:MAG: NTP transferase domain-containing protein [Terracoccus sp.]